MAATLRPTHGRFSEYLRACEAEALTLEAVGHHYLQDAWSMGHMWERWGSPDINDFPGADAEERREAAVVAALTSGLIHGSKSKLDELFGSRTGFVYDDALCAPVVPSRYSASISEPILRTFAPPQYIDGLGAGPVPAVGDLFLGRLTRSVYPGQYNALYACAASGIREVYLAAGSNHGAAAPSRTDTVDPTGDACLGQRATNSSFYLGLGVDYTVPSSGAQVHFDITSDFAATTLIRGGALFGGGVGYLTDARAANYRVDLARIAAVARIRAVTRPNGTELARGFVGDLIGVHRNGRYVHTGATPLATYIDPPLPWTASSREARRALALARTFHRAHADELCATTTMADLDALRARVSAPLDAEGRLAACEACAAVASRHLRLGTSVDDYDRSAEPLCRALGHATSPVVYQSPRGNGDQETHGRAWCGCGEALAVTDRGLARVAFSGAAVSRLPVAGDAAGFIAYGSGLGAIAVTHADGPRALVTNFADGTLSVLSLERGAERELDTDGDATTTTAGAPAGVTRVTLGGGAQGLGVTPDGRYALVGTASEEVVVIDLADYSVCKRFTVGVAPAALEAVQSIVVTRDNRKAYVSLTHPNSAGPHSVAVLDLAATVACDTAGGEVSGRIVDLPGTARPGALALSPDGTRLAIVARGANRVAIVETATDTTVDLQPGDPSRRFFWTGQGPQSLAWARDGRRLFIGNVRGLAGTYLSGVGAVGYGTFDARGATPAGGTGYDVGVTNAVTGLVLDDDDAWVYAADFRGNVTALDVELWTNAPGRVSRPYDGTGGCLDAVYRAVACPVTLNLGSPIRGFLRY